MCVQCKYDFCWICLEEWKKHSSSTGGYYRCTRYEVIQQVEEQSKEMTVEVHILTCMPKLFCLFIYLLNKVRVVIEFLIMKKEKDLGTEYGCAFTFTRLMFFVFLFVYFVFSRLRRNTRTSRNWIASCTITHALKTMSTATR